MKKLGFVIILSALAWLPAVNAVAGDEVLPLSYAYKAPDEKVQKNLDNLVTWAKGELAEHIMEGLFDAYPEEKQLIENMIGWAEEMRRQAAAASQAGDVQAARARYFSAEATARYAAQMPHLLEDRVKH